MEHSFTCQLWGYFPNEGKTGSFRIPYYNYIKKKIAKIEDWKDTS